MEIGLAVGGAFLSSSLNVLFDRLAPQGDLLNMFHRDKRDVRLLRRLKMTLLGLQAVLSDAENKQASNPYVSQWLNELQDAVDSAENLIEEVNYEVMRLKVEDQHQNLGETSNSQVSDHNLCLSDDFFRNIKEKLEENIETLEELEKQIGRLDLTKYLDSGKQEKREFSTSVVDESDILGRQSEIEELLGSLVSDDAISKNLTVIPIVGLPGIGKTTLAKAVYNDESVKKHFDLKAWTCVSEPYDILRITKELLQEIGFLNVDNNLNQLQVKLKESLKGKKFLIVLDDVWNVIYKEWDDLRNLFVQGDIGSKIIVTTRKESVALMMGSGAINVGTLSSEVSWALFKRHSLENRDPEEHPKLEEVGKQIAHKCKGLPLALKALAGILRSKSEVDEWRDILRSKIWELPPHSNGILPALMLSYNDLPVHLKRCFAFCAIYPKDYLFCKEQVIHLWIANGLVQQLDSAKQYFLELRSRSLFERVQESSGWNPGEFLMHDLVNDLAQIASSNLCIRLEDIDASHMLERTRHLSYSMGYGDFGKLKTLNKLEQLRTLLPISIQRGIFTLSKRVMHNILPRLTSLRALSLSHYHHIKELPDDLFIKLKHLRFLDLSWTRIKKLPDSICVLYNLETLILSNCRCLEELPLQMEKLINLCRLDISDTSLLKTPLHPSKLKSLHMLVGAKFHLTGCSSLRIEDMGEVHDLYGSLSITELQNVVDKREALKANMREKEHVERLYLEWSGSIADNSQTERDILDELQPNLNIKGLRIAGYRGTKFPNWLADHSFHKLIELSLSNCKDCDSLPALGRLPSLKFLTIRGMHRITEVTEEFYGSSSSKKPFNSLEKLGFAEMPEWKQWHVLGKGEFPILEELSIEDCPKLIGKLPQNLSSLMGLRILKCPELSLETPIQLSNLKRFDVVGCPKVGVVFDDAQLFTSQLEGMKQIVELSITDCKFLTSLPISRLSNTLKNLRIYGCGKLKLETPVSEIISNMFLEHLELRKCDSIDDISPELFPRARVLRVERCRSPRLLIRTGTEKLSIRDCGNLEMLSVACGTQMTSLQIHECKKLKSLPEHMHELLPSLKELTLNNCPEIESFPEGGLPFNLQVLDICDCKKLVNGLKQWRLQRLPRLEELIIFHDGSDLAGENWELPCSIQRLSISNMNTLSSQLLKKLTSLEYLYTRKIPQIQSLLEEGLPSSLSELTLHNLPDLHSLPAEGLQRLTWLRRLDIQNCPNLQSLSESGMPSSLSLLRIFECPNLQSLPESGMPSSLSELYIFFCPNLQSLPESGMPSSLSELYIFFCPNLQSLPVKGMPPSISKLFISECPLLKPLLKFDKGDYWPKIANIPTIHIDGESH
ncbi:putative disease resistance RPP13-like protein 1 [Solanum dulcamara]|uniref:putative disease resistance RPP13-like protein 1 n=1 Tax=Solanum dulcamara TaxID=45834 RepID=UPI002485C2BE|nr:putative disease resistance RPP13-like protein 1 [Solanum dulcamara]XP_055835832.1 putative disease resistance RPP13-like protein 1 [Solanum dulcamara]XP_055835833.1 putative disease resistance RPP13-like protein 1 [Solanum dulcamara]XP_055835834.1 putative disease resistance RPP13-like protein 1 [Solanum dulcamara]XP_055835835.1 putative disease resistance RPP13-like protein 1 [Solanum dulcamara]XP_055835836.1 putative disease resistance RPP13-like protein 1 [Solanum dulcamara]XP_05583583